MNHQTVMASEVQKRIAELIAEHGDMPIWFMEPMGGRSLPINPAAIEVNNGRIELWPGE